MKAIIFVTAALCVCACDRQESPGEELNEAFESVKEGRALEDVGRQAKDVLEAAKNDRTDLERRLDNIDKWVEERVHELEEGAENAGAKASEGIDDIQSRAATARESLERDTSKAASEVAEWVEGLEQDIASMGEGQ